MECPRVGVGMEHGIWCPVVRGVERNLDMTSWELDYWTAANVRKQRWERLVGNTPQPSRWEEVEADG